MLVYGDTNSTLAGARAAAPPACRSRTSRPGCAAATSTMPEERNRIEVDRARGAALLPGRALARDARARGRRRPRRGRRRRDGRRAAAASRRSRASARRARAPRLEPGGYVVATDPPRGERAAGTGSAASSTGLTGSTEPVVFPAHPRTRAAIAARRARARPARRARRAARLPRLRRARLAGARDRHRLGRAAEGGVLVRRPVRDRCGPRRSGSTRSSRARTCSSTTTRTRSPPPSRGADARRAPAALRRRPRLASGSRRPLAYAARVVSAQTEPEPRLATPQRARDVAIVGAGYVGVPLAQVFAEAGRSRAARRRRRRRASTRSTAARATSRTSRPSSSRRSSRRAHRGDDRLRRAARGGRDPDRAADAALASSASPTSRSSRGAAREIAHAPAPGPPRRARVDDVPGHDARDRAARSSRQGSGLDGRRGLPPRVLARARRPRPHRLDDAERRRRSSAASTRRCTEAAAALYGGAIDTVHRVSSPEAAELTKLLENIFRSVNIALVNELAQLCDRMGIDVWEVDRRRRDEAVRLHALRARARASAATASRSTRSTSPGRRASTTSTTEFIELAGKVNNEHAVLLPLGRLAGAQPRRAASRSRARGSSCSASRTRRTSATCASRRRVKLIELLRERRAPRSPTTTRTCPSFARARARVGAARAGGATTAS